MTARSWSYRYALTPGRRAGPLCFPIVGDDPEAIEKQLSMAERLLQTYKQLGELGMNDQQKYHLLAIGFCSSVAARLQVRDRAGGSGSVGAWIHRPLDAAEEDTASNIKVKGTICYVPAYVSETV